MSGKIVLASICSLEQFLNNFALTKQSLALDPLPPSYLKQTMDSEFPRTFDFIPKTTDRNLINRAPAIK